MPPRVATLFRQKTSGTFHQAITFAFASIAERGTNKHHRARKIFSIESADPEWNVGVCRRIISKPSQSCMQQFA